MQQTASRGGQRSARQLTTGKHNLTASLLAIIKILFKNTFFGGKEGKAYRLMELKAGKEF